MRTRLCSRPSGLRRYGLPLIAVVAVAAALIPAQAAATEQQPRAAVEDPEYPPPPTAGDLRADPEIASIIQDADYALKYSMAVVAADPSTPYPAGILSMPADRQKAAAEAARQMITDPAVRKREFGRHGAIDPAKYAQLGFDGVFTPESVPFDRAALKNRLTDRAARIEATHRIEEATAKDMALKYQIPMHLQIPTLSSLDYRIERVRCADETNPEWPGDDEIAMGGVAVGHNGATTKVNQFMVADDFDDNEVKVYADPGKLFHRFDLTGTGAWPRTYSTVVMLAVTFGAAVYSR